MRSAIFTLACLLTAQAFSAGDAGLLPAANFPNGWNPDGKPKIFTGSELYGHIDGGAEIFFEFGFEELTVQRYAHSGDVLEVELYRLSDPAAALGIYLGRCGAETPDPGLAERHTAGLHQLLLVRDRFVVIVSNLGGKAELAPALVQLARAIGGRLPPTVPAAAFELLPRDGRIPGSERLIRGPIALQSLITLGEGDVLQLGGRVTAVAASYAERPRHPAHTLIVARYSDVSAAARVLAHLKANLDAQITLLRNRGDSFVFRDYAGRFGVAKTSDQCVTIALNLAHEPLGP